VNDVLSDLAFLNIILIDCLSGSFLAIIVVVLLNPLGNDVLLLVFVFRNEYSKIKGSFQKVR
jgi:hypothetical protein